MKIKAAVFKLHSYLGLISGIFILIFGLTGALLLFSEEIDELFYHEILTTSPTEKKSYDQAYTLVSSAYPDYIPYRIAHGINDHRETIEIGLQKNNFKERLSVYVDPVSGEIKGKLHNTVTEIILKLHYTFFLDKVGELIAAIFALSLIGSIVTGIIVYRKYVLKVLLFKVPVKFQNWRKASSELHRVLGVWALIFNLILAFSGFWLLRHTFDVKSHFSEEEINTKAATLNASIDQASIQAKKLIPDLTITYISLPGAEGDPLVIYGDTPGDLLFGIYNNYAEFDATSGTLINVVKEEDLSTSEKFDNTLYTLHFGQYGGMTIKIIYTFFSLATAVISITGFLLWWRRNRNKTGKRKPSSNKKRAVTSAL